MKKWYSIQWDLCKQNYFVALTHPKNIPTLKKIEQQSPPRMVVNCFRFCLGLLYMTDYWWIGMSPMVEIQTLFETIRQRENKSGIPPIPRSSQWFNMIQPIFGCMFTYCVWVLSAPPSLLICGCFKFNASQSTSPTLGPWSENHLNIEGWRSQSRSVGIFTTPCREFWMSNPCKPFLVTGAQSTGSEVPMVGCHKRLLKRPAPHSMLPPAPAIRPAHSLQ